MGKGIGPVFGRHSFVTGDNWDNTWNDEIRVGNFTSISEGVVFRGVRSQHAFTEHRDMVVTYDLPVVLPKILDKVSHEHPPGWPIMGMGTGRIDIGSDVWIGSNVLLVTSHSLNIGHGVIIGAGSVVSESIPPYTIVVGNPCVVKGYRYLSHIIEELLEIQWWNWSDEEIIEASPHMLNVNQFIEKYRVSKKS